MSRFTVVPRVRRAAAFAVWLAPPFAGREAALRCTSLTSASTRSPGCRKVVYVGLLLAFLLTNSAVAANDLDGPCFDYKQPVVEPLKPPIELVPGRDNHTFGVYPNGFDWASARAVLAMPIQTAYARLRDHRNLKDMAKTTLTIRVDERPPHLALQWVDVVVTLRALFLKVKVPWTEAWAFALVEGTKEEPRRIVASYQKVGGTSHLQHLCGSYVLQARDDGTTDISMYEEVKADRRSARDTSNMHRGILRNIRNAKP
jgi:hypothetical protein